MIATIIWRIEINAFQNADRYYNYYMLGLKKQSGSTESVHQTLLFWIGRIGKVDFEWGGHFEQIFQTMPLTL